MLLRHILWLYSRHQTRQPPETVEEKAWVFDGVRVALARRHQYAFGRPHTTRPVHSVTCRVAGTQFRDRLLIPHPHHRRALRRLLHAKEKGLVCCEQVRLLALWLQDETETGGWPTTFRAPACGECPSPHVCPVLLSLLLFAGSDSARYLVTTTRTSWMMIVTMRSKYQYSAASCTSSLIVCQSCTLACAIGLRPPPRCKSCQRASLLGVERGCSKTGLCRVRTCPRWHETHRCYTTS